MKKIPKYYRIRQSINCEAVHIVYLVTCKKEGCEGRQGVGQTKSLKARLANYTGCPRKKRTQANKPKLNKE